MGEPKLGLIVVVGAYVVAIVGIAGAAEPGVAEASVVLAAPLATFGGAKIGHGSGDEEGRSLFDLCLAASSLAAFGAALFFMIGHEERRTASSSLMVAAGGIGLAHLWHHFLGSTTRIDGIVGGLLLAGAFVVGLIWIWTDRRNAETIATIAAAGVTVGGTLIGHAHGRSTSRA